jgi:MFS family permease
MNPFVRLLRDNSNYRAVWMGQVVSEVGDHFNNIAVFSLAMEATKSGLVVSGIMLARGAAMILGGPVAGVLLDRMDRKRLMIVSDLFRAVIATLFILTVRWPEPWLMFLLSGLLMFASPFFTSGRASVLPSIATHDELHAANSVTQITQWTTLVIGAMLGGVSVVRFGYEWAFLLNAASFLFSWYSISRLRAPKGGFRASRKALTEADVARPWRDYAAGLRYMRATPLILGIAFINFGWATGGGAAQILFSLFGEVVFARGAAGIGEIWGCAGIGLLAGGAFGHWYGKRIDFERYKLTISICYIVHGGAYVVFSQMHNYLLALFFIALSRAAVAVSSVLNMWQLLTYVSNEYRGRVFATLETLTWSTMMLSMLGAGLASQSVDARTIGAWSGALSSTTAIGWAYLNWSGRLPAPRREGVPPNEVEIHGEPTA